MPREFSRSSRLSEQIKRELARIIQLELPASKIGMVTLTHVDLAKDLSVADVYFTSLLDLSQNDHEEKAEHYLKGVASYLRTELAGVLSVRMAPKVRFHYDRSVKRGQKLSELIDQAIKKESYSKT